MQLSAEGLAAGQILRERRETLAHRVTALCFESRPELAQRWKGGRQECTEDYRRHLDHLCEALTLGRPALFTEYAAWAAALLARLNIPRDEAAFPLELLLTTLSSELEGASGLLVSQYLDAAIAKIDSSTPEVSGHIEGDGPLDVLARDYLAALLRGERHTASRLIHVRPRAALRSRISTSSSSNARSTSLGGSGLRT